MEKLFWALTVVVVVALLWLAYRIRYTLVWKSVLAEYYRREDEEAGDSYVYLGGPFPALTRVPSDQRSSIKEGMILDQKTGRWVKTARMSDFLYDRLTT